MNFGGRETRHEPLSRAGGALAAGPRSGRFASRPFSLTRVSYDRKHGFAPLHAYMSLNLRNAWRAVGASKVFSAAGSDTLKKVFFFHKYEIKVTLYI